MNAYHTDSKRAGKASKYIFIILAIAALDASGDWQNPQSINSAPITENEGNPDNEKLRKISDLLRGKYFPRYIPIPLVKNCQDIASDVGNDLKDALCPDPGFAGWKIDTVVAVDTDREPQLCHDATMITSPNGGRYLFDPMLDPSVDNHPLDEDTLNGRPIFRCAGGKPCTLPFNGLGGQKCEADYYEMTSGNDTRWGSGDPVPPPIHVSCSGNVMANGPNLLSTAGRACIINPEKKDFPENTAVRSFDPNDKVGSRGVDVKQYLSGQESLRYVISFENLETATAPAQEVVITDDLSANSEIIDLNSFSLGSISFGNKVMSPPPGRSTFATDVDLRPEKNLLVRIRADLDITTKILSWHFSSIDPTTGGLTTDPLGGFLPPNTDANAPKGSGSVAFTVMPKKGLATGTEVRNRARIVFDTNAPIDTPEWLNTLDNTKPQSLILGLPQTQTSTTFQVVWQGDDQGAGVTDYTVYVAENGGAFTPWQTNTAQTSAMFTGQVGKRYDFYSIARDQVGNEEGQKTVADTSTIITEVISNQPPLVNAGPDIQGTIGTLVTLQGSANDPDNGPEPLTYAWTQTSGPNVTLSGATTLTPSFTPTTAGDYVFSLLASDGKDSSAPDSVTVNVSAPVADAPIRVLQPNGGETWKVGAASTITWSVSPKLVLPKVPASVWLSKDAGSHWWPIGIDLKKSSSFTWKPDRQFATTQALIKVCMLSNQKLPKPVCDVSDATFSITK